MPAQLSCPPGLLKIAQVELPETSEAMCMALRHDTIAVGSTSKVRGTGLSFGSLR